MLLDSSDYLQTPLGRLLKASGLADRYLRGGDEFPPVVRGLGLTVIPRPEKLYYSIGKRIDMARYRGHADNPAVLRRARYADWRTGCSEAPRWARDWRCCVAAAVDFRITN